MVKVCGVHSPAPNGGRTMAQARVQRKLVKVLNRAGFRATPSGQTWIRWESAGGESMTAVSVQPTTLRDDECNVLIAKYSAEKPALRVSEGSDSCGGGAEGESVGGECYV